MVVTHLKSLLWFEQNRILSARFSQPRSYCSLAFHLWGLRDVCLPSSTLIKHCGPAKARCFHRTIAGWKIYPKISDLSQLFIARRRLRKQMRPGRRSSRVPSPSATGAKAGAEPHLPSLLIGSPAHYFCLTCCSSLWEERALQLACIPDHRGCRGYPGWLWSSWVNLRAPFVVCGARSPELASVGAEMRGPALEWVVLGNRLRPGRKEWQSLKKRSGGSSFFFKASCRYSSVQVWFRRELRHWFCWIGFPERALGKGPDGSPLY